MKKTVSLNGVWKFAPTYDQKVTNNHNVIESSIPMYAHPALLRTHWENVTVPGVWQKYAEKYSVFEGVCWFFREFELDCIDEKSFVNLVFKAVNYRADVYVNGKYIGCHESAYTEFSMDISKFVQNGKNYIAVQVDNRPTEVKWPNDWGYGVYGGIHRDVFVEVYNDDYASDIELIPDYDTESKSGILNFRCSLHGGADSVAVKIGNTEKILKGEDGRISAVLTYEGISAWSPENPVLYKCEIRIADEIYKECNIGFRNIRTQGTNVLLNGEKTRMNGACYVYDSPVHGIVMDQSQLEYDMKKMKEANVNAIRTHYPMSDNFYELCDKMGFMVWIEPNIYCSKPANEEKNTVFKREDFVEVAVSMTEEMIKGGQQYASVVIWGIGNECNVYHEEAVPFFKKISDTVRKLDSTRLVGYACLYEWSANIHEVIDILGVNSYHGWYGTIKTFETIDDVTKASEEVTNRVPDVSGLDVTLEHVKTNTSCSLPMLLTEFGADSVPGYYSPAHDLWSEEYHADVVRMYIEKSLEHKEVCGTFVFNFTDYLDPSKPLNGRWNGLNLKGMLTYNRDIKLPFYALRDAYAKVKTTE